MRGCTHIRNRWTIAGLLLSGVTINYVDRQTLSVLAPVLRDELKLSSLQYSYVVSAFLIVYLLMYPAAGRILDRLGTRRGLGIGVILWSVAEMLHAAASGVVGLSIARAMLAVGEATIIPGAIKAVAECFSERQRSLAIGVVEIGLSLGPIVATPVTVWIALHQGWRWAFLWTGAVGVVWAVPWLMLYRAPARSAPQTVAVSSMPLRQILRSRALWAVGLARFFGDPVWYFYLFWLPKYLNESKGFSVTSVGVLGWIPYLGSLCGGLMGGAISSWLVRRGMVPVAARKRVMLVSAPMVSCGMLSIYTTNVFWVVLVITVASFAMLAWGVNLDTLLADIFPSECVGQATGLAGLFGGLGGILFTALSGYVVEHLSYTPLWLATAVTYPLGFLLLSYLLQCRVRSHATGESQARHVAACLSRDRP